MAHDANNEPSANRAQRVHTRVEVWVASGCRCGRVQLVAVECAHHDLHQDLYESAQVHLHANQLG